MEQLLLQLLKALEAIGEENEEIGDTECRDAMRAAVYHSFLLPKPGYRLPATFGLYSKKSNQLVREALAVYIKAAKAEAKKLDLSFRGRLVAFQNAAIHTEDGTTSDEFFGYTPPTMWTEFGEWLGRRDDL